MNKILRSGAQIGMIAPIVLLFVLLLAFPSESLSAAVRGVAIWWEVLFPALLPFLVISELLLGFGVVHLIGTLLDPLMRPLFRVPGIGGFVMTMGFASGYPVAARLTAQLWEQRLVNREEGERLVGFATTSDPIFLIGAVSVGFFGNPGLAPVLAAAHYGSALLLGFAMRWHGRRQPVAGTRTGHNHSASAAHNGTAAGAGWSGRPREHADGRNPTGGNGPAPEKNAAGGSLLKRAVRAMLKARNEDGRPFSVLLQDALQSSLRLIIVIGGLVVFFSVVLELLTSAGMMRLVYELIEWTLYSVGLPAPLSAAVGSGFFEVTLGAKAAGTAGAGLPLVGKAAIAAFILSWAGFSVHAQIVSLLTRTNLRYVPFAAARLVHGILAAVLVYVFWSPLAPVSRQVEAAWMPDAGMLLPVWTWGMVLAAGLGLLLLGLLLLASALLIVCRLVRRRPA